MNRQSVSSGVKWEQLYGYCRATRIGEGVGSRILVSGTTATAEDGGAFAKGDAGAQTHFVIDKIEQAIVELGGRLEDIVRTRVYVSDLAHWQPIAEAHGERFGDIRPANTLVEARLVGDDFLVEIEAEAIIGAGSEL